MRSSTCGSSVHPPDNNIPIGSNDLCLLENYVLFQGSSVPNTIDVNVLSGEALRDVVGSGSGLHLKPGDWNRDGSPDTKDSI